MLKYFKFKHKIILMPTIAILTLFLMLFVALYYNRTNENLLFHIGVLKLNYDLEKTHTALQRTLDDAVKERDEQVLALADSMYSDLSTILRQGREAGFYPEDDYLQISKLMQDNYREAREISRYLVDGGQLNDASIQTLRQITVQKNEINDILEAHTDIVRKQISDTFQQVQNRNAWSAIIMSGIILLSTGLLIGLTVLITKATTSPVREMIRATNQFADGDHAVRTMIDSHDEIGELAEAINNMMEKLERQDWFKSSQAELSRQLYGEYDVGILAQKIITFLVKTLDARIGAIYLVEKDRMLKLVSSYAFQFRVGDRSTFAFGEGLVGQAALERQPIVFRDIPADALTIRSGLMEIRPNEILVQPFMYEGEVKGVIELATTGEFNAVHLEFLAHACDNISIVLHSVQSRGRMQELLDETRCQSEILQTQQEKLQSANEKLEERTQALEQQREILKEKNRDLQKARKLNEEKAKDLERANKYNAEFFANMSHELRTPLNSMLILSKILNENKEGNLTAKQLEFARTIYSAGSDLLELINEILDLSKIEAGKMQLFIDEVNLRSLAAYIRQNFEHVATEKGLFLRVRIDPDLPTSIQSDRQRVQQILNNLISNGLKFTSQGGVTIRIFSPTSATDMPDYVKSRFAADESAVAISVADTGIGIPADKQKLIFEDFQQTDEAGRHFGGTGLGLSIARKLTSLLGGEIFLESEENKGSVFTVLLPAKRPEQPFSQIEVPPEDTPQKLISPVDDAQFPPLPAKHDRLDTAFKTIWDDRKGLLPSDRSVLIIDDDVNFSRMMFDAARERGFKCLVAGEAEAGLQLTLQYKPSAIILDVGLPGIGGWTVMKRLKEDPETRSIPVYFVTAADDPLRAMKMGAIGHQTKPLTESDLDRIFETIEQAIQPKTRNLLIVSENNEEREKWAHLFDHPRIAMRLLDFATALAQLTQNGHPDCIVLDCQQHEDSAREIIKKVRATRDLAHMPVIIYCPADAPAAPAELAEYPGTVMAEGQMAQQRLLSQVSLYLHLPETDFQKNTTETISGAETDLILVGKTILLADDDMRNIFALSSIFEDKGLNVMVAENGREALRRLAENPEISLVLIDIMMPEMDGYEAIREIRRQPQYADLPIIVLTAKAMKGDRQKCIEAGANEYLSKPIDTDKLLSLLRVWLYDAPIKDVAPQGA